MNPPVVITVGSADPNAAPLTVNELFTLLQTVISGQIIGSYIPYIIGSSTPSVDDQDKAWIQLDTSGRPLAIKTFFGGLWRRVYNGMINEIRGFWGDPTVLTDWDANGHGIAGGEYDGWQLCNGLNGSPNFTDKFIIGGHLDNSAGHIGYNSGWQTFIDGVADLKTGGFSYIPIQTVHVPNLTVPEIPAIPAIPAIPPIPPIPPIPAGPIIPAHTISIDIGGNEYKADADHTPDTAILIDVHYANLLSHSQHIADVLIPDIPGTPAVPKRIRLAED